MTVWSDGVPTEVIWIIILYSISNWSTELVEDVFRFSRQ